MPFLVDAHGISRSTSVVHELASWARYDGVLVGTGAGCVCSGLELELWAGITDVILLHRRGWDQEFPRWAMSCLFGAHIYDVSGGISDVHELARWTKCYKYVQHTTNKRATIACITSKMRMYTCVRTVFLWLSLSLTLTNAIRKQTITHTHTPRANIFWTCEVLRSIVPTSDR